jgi:hypothetical protein
VPLLVLVSVAVVVGGLLAIRAALSHHRQPGGPPCLATVGTASYPLDLEQATNATTIAAVGKRMGLPDHAVTIALAAALQESKMYNLPGGDLDSVGLFQQRPSQGWGTPSQIMNPIYAASTFYNHLAKVPGWQTMAVTEAAQSVQHSAAPDAYAGWEPEARMLAQVLTGETPAGLACRFQQSASGSSGSGSSGSSVSSGSSGTSGSAPSSALATAMTQELGSPATGVSVSSARGWTVASWLVGHAQQYHIQSVVYAGQTWTPAQTAWKPAAANTAEVQFTVR